MELEELSNKQKKVLVNLVLILLFIFVSYRYIYNNQAKKLDSLRAKKDLEIKINEALQNIISQEANLDSYGGFLLKDSSPIINSISDIAKQNGVELVSIIPEPEQSKGDYIIFPFDLTIKTPGFHALGEFISGLENYKDIYIIDDLQITDDEQNNALSVFLKISAVGNIDKGNAAN